MIGQVGREPSEAPANIDTSSIAGTVVVLCEDADVRDELLGVLNGQWPVLIAPSADDAVRSVTECDPSRPFAAIVSDIALDRDDMRALRASFEADPRLARVPIIAVREAAVGGDEKFGAETEFESFSLPIGARELSVRILAAVRIRSRQLEWMTKLRAETARADGEQVRLQQLIRQSSSGICLLSGPEHVIESANSPFMHMVFDRPGILERPFGRAFPELAEQGYVDLLDDVYKTGETFSAPEAKLWLEENGTRIECFFDLTFQRLLTPDGRPEGILFSAIDVTDRVVARKLIERSGERFRELADSMPQLVAVVSHDGQPVYFNRGWKDYFGGAIGTEEHWETEIVHPEDLPGLAERFTHCRETGELFEGEARLKGKDGSYRWFLGRAVPVRNSAGKVVRWNGTATDIQERKLLEQQLLTERRLAEEANRTKSAFLANVSHEIRTPMAAVLGFADSLRDPSLTASERDDFLQRIGQSGRSLLGLIDDILDVSRLESGKMRLVLTRFSPLQTVREAVAMLEPKAMVQGTRVEVQSLGRIPELVVSDERRLRQILLSLIGNAVKFTKAGRVLVTVRSEPGSRSTDTILAVDVEDSGVGIGMDQQARLFQPFSQADDSSTRVFGGTGLGLILARRLAECMGGDLALVRSSPGAGATFTVRVRCDLVAGRSDARPLETTPISLGSSTAASRKPELDGVRVLLVEDVPDNQILMRRYLEAAGALVDIADNGAQAIVKAGAKPYDIVLMDVQMPILDGLNATRELRESGYSKPIVALTANAMREERSRSFRAGCNGHITKPIARRELIDQVHKHLSLFH